MKTITRLRRVLPPLLLLALPLHAQVIDQLKQTLLSTSSPPASTTNFGSALAVDSNIVVVGVPWTNLPGANIAGAVRVMYTNGIQIAYITNPSPSVSAQFGAAVAVAGTKVIVGAPYANTGVGTYGRVYVYDLSNLAAPIYTINNPSIYYGHFGGSVAISGNKFAVGNLSTYAYVFDLAGPNPTIPSYTFNDSHLYTVSNDPGFGKSIAISGNYVVVGHPNEYRNWPFAGGATLYNIASGTPTTPVYVMQHTNPATSDAFGTSVAITGTSIVVGAANDDTNYPADPNSHDEGTAWMFDVNYPGAIASLGGGAVPNEHYGTSIAISGTRVLVGGVEASVSGVLAGRVVILDASSPLYNKPVTLVVPHPVPANYDHFGQAVAISGNRFVIGAPYQDAGAADVGNVYFYDFVGSPAPPTPVASFDQIHHYYGSAVAVSGTRVVVGAPDDMTTGQQSGRAFVYDSAGASPATPVATFENPSPNTQDRFGSAVAISGTKVAVGAFQDDTNGIDDGRVYIFDIATPNAPTYTLNNPGPANSDNFGMALAMNGQKLAVGVPGDDSGGLVYLYDLTSGTPTVPVRTFLNPWDVSYDGFGTAVALNNTYLIVGASSDSNTTTEAGSFNLFNASTGGYIATYFNPTPANQDHFGTSVSLSSSNMALIGAPDDDLGTTNAGCAHLYNLAGGPPTTFANPSPVINERFGASVAISGNRIAIGVPGDDTAATDAGIAHFYDLGSPAPTTPVSTITNPSPAASDAFGAAIALDASLAAIGCAGDDTIASNSGAAYLLGPSPFASWKLNVAGNAFLDPATNTDYDSLNLLAEYALVFLPNHFDSDPIAATPFTYAEGKRLRLFVQRDPTRNDVTVEIQASPDLLPPWTTLATSANGSPFSGPGYVSGDAATAGLKTVEIRDLVNMTAAAKRFVRVKVTR